MFALAQFSLSLLAFGNLVVSQKVDCSQYSNMSTTYPNQARICSIFAPLTAGGGTNFATFFDHVVDNVNWTIEGTHPLAGKYNNKTVLEAAFGRITATAAQGTPLQLSLINIIGGGNEAWSAQELQVQGKCNSGLFFDNRYAWVTKWNKSGFITEARAYLDSALVAAAIFSSEIGAWTYSDQREKVTPFVNLSPQQLAGASGLQVLTA